MGGEMIGDEGMIEALDKEIATNQPEPGAEAPAADPIEPKPGEEAAPAAPKPGEAPKPDDPEIDLGLDEKGQPIKLKRSQILEFQKNGMLHSDYTKKTQELAAEKANLKEVIDIIDYLKKNPAKAERVVKILEEKEEQAKEQEFDLKKALGDVDKLLADLPADDPYAQALRSQKAMIEQSIKVNEQLQKRLDQLDQGQRSEQENKLSQEADQTLQEVISSKTKALSFADPEEADYWKKQTLTYLVNNPKEYADMDKQQFTDFFNKLGDKVYADMQKLGEKHVSRYIKSKGQPGGVPVVGAAPAAGSPGNQPITQDNLQDSLERELEKVDKENQV